MTNRAVKVLLILNLTVFTGILVRPSVTSGIVAAQSTATPFKDNQELVRLYEADQSDQRFAEDREIGEAAL